MPRASAAPSWLCLLLLILAGLLLPGRLPAQAPAPPRKETIDYVLERYVQMMGGRGALERIRSVRMTGTITYPDGSRASLTVMKKKPNRVRITLESGMMRATQGYDGQVAWVMREVGNMRLVERMSGKTAETFIREAPLENLLVNPRNSGVRIELGPDRTAGRIECYQVIASLPDGSRTIHLIDKESFMERRILEYNSAGELVAELIPSRFETHGGVVFAMQIVRLQDGKTASTLSLDEVRLNFGILDTAFAPPPGLPPEEAASAAAVQQLPQDGVAEGP